MKDKETRITALRKNNNLTQKQVALFLNVKEDTYSKWERGTNDLPLTKINELANYYHVSIDFLLGMSNRNLETPNKEINLNLFCKRLKEIRKKHNLSQTKLCQNVGFPQTTYSCYENGSSIPTTFKVYYIASYYNISFDYLIGRSDNPNIP